MLSGMPLIVTYVGKCRYLPVLTEARVNTLPDHRPGIYASLNSVTKIYSPLYY
jgi:hypothetical protein